MKAFVLAAGLGTRLRPFTLSHPKALVPVGGVPMLGRVLSRLESQGFSNVVVNVHHFGDQIIEYLGQRDNEKQIVEISDERSQLLNTGGALQHASGLLCKDNKPILVHNVDILSNADLRGLYDHHLSAENDITLLVSDRDSSRKLVFNDRYLLRAWHNVKDGIYKPVDFQRDGRDSDYAFSGIYVISPRAIEAMRSYGFEGEFSIIDYILAVKDSLKVEGYVSADLRMIDIGKPETLAQANTELSEW
ncbi:MAG: NTP transferase domain-containing protein [Muribaculaceae bacterium]|nr:NTP transferase domain-containing protein [Muribaculaceae bacterium]